jgi:putative membrane protein
MTRKPVAFRIEAETKPAAERAPRTKRKAARKKAPARKSSNARKPTALPIDDIVLEPADFEARQQPVIAVREPETVARTIRWGAIFLAAFTGLMSMWASVTFIGLIEDLFARSTILGWIGSGLLALAGLAALVILLREIFGLFALRKISKIRRDAETARNMNDARAAERVGKALAAIYDDRADVSWGLAELKQHEADIIDASDRIAMIERDLMSALDEQAGQIIASASRRVTVLTAIAPTALLDMAFVAAQNLKMLRQLATLYGGRPGHFGTVKLAGMVVSHLAVTGGLALSDAFLQQFVGKGLLGRLSARFGEGAFNGILTTRIGISALDLTRPVPFSDTTRPQLTDFLKNIVNFPPSVD